MVTACMMKDCPGAICSRAGLPIDGTCCVQAHARCFTCMNGFNMRLNTDHGSEHVPSKSAVAVALQIRAITHFQPICFTDLYTFGWTPALHPGAHTHTHTHTHTRCDVCSNPRFLLDSMLCTAYIIAGDGDSELSFRTAPPPSSISLDRRPSP